MYENVSEVYGWLVHACPFKYSNVFFVITSVNDWLCIVHSYHVRLGILDVNHDIVISVDQESKE